jgi:CheY-like chemotaxis protein
MTANLEPFDCPVLCVEDDAQVRQSLTLMVQSLGFRVLEASNAKEALALFRAVGKAVRLVISDVVMPGMDGVTLCRELASQRPNLRSILISGMEREFLRELYALPQEAVFIHKPFDIMTLEKEICHFDTVCVQ